MPVQDTKKRFMDKVWMEPNSGCWLWTAGISKFGYGKFSIGKKTLAAHRVSWELHNCEIPKDSSYRHNTKLVLHKCDVKSCVNPDHLFLGTCQDNMDDKHEKCREFYKFGESLPQSKLNEFQVKCIRRLLEFSAMKQKEIGKIFGVHQQNISKINTGARWGRL